MAYYPSSKVTFSRKVDLTSLVVANDVNSVYDEVEQMQIILGTTPSRVASWTATSTPDFTAPKVWTDLGERLSNIEVGTYQSFTNRVSTFGGSTITSSATGVVGLVIKPIASQSVNIFEIKNAAGSSNLVTVDTSGTLFAVTIDGGSA
jgi:hypothetical protein